MILLVVFGSIMVYLLAAGITHGYAKFHWPEKLTGWNRNYDENEPIRIFAVVFGQFIGLLSGLFAK